jgi:hypothetical protein
VNAAHQWLGASPGTTVWTWYHALADTARRRLPAAGCSSVRGAPGAIEIVADLRRAHPDIGPAASCAWMCALGARHGAPRARHPDRVRTLEAWRPAPRLFPAHADLSGFSLFEEAQWHGVQAAEAVARTL